MFTLPQKKGEDEAILNLLMEGLPVAMRFFCKFAQQDFLDKKWSNPQKIRGRIWLGGVTQIP